MDYINYVPPTSEYYVSEEEFDDQSITEDDDFKLEDIESVIEFTSTMDIQQISENAEVKANTGELHSSSTMDNKRKYKKYGPEQIRQFIKIMQDEGSTVPKAAARCSIPRGTAYKLFAEFNESDGTVLPGSASKAKNRGTKQKLFPQHTKFIVDYLENNRMSTLKLAREALLQEFADVGDISLTSLWKHIKNECTIPVKQE
ncbi:unnamed protein product [Mucor hiemalis]